MPPPIAEVKGRVEVYTSTLPPPSHQAFMVSSRVKFAFPSHAFKQFLIAQQKKILVPLQLLRQVSRLTACVKTGGWIRIRTTLLSTEKDLDI
jgi:hypothetical protein